MELEPYLEFALESVQTVADALEALVTSQWQASSSSTLRNDELATATTLLLSPSSSSSSPTSSSLAPKLNGAPAGRVAMNLSADGRLASTWSRSMSQGISVDIGNGNGNGNGTGSGVIGIDPCKIASAALSAGFNQSSLFIESQKHNPLAHRYQHQHHHLSSSSWSMSSSMYIDMSESWYLSLAFITLVGFMISLISNAIILYLFTTTLSLRRNPSNIIAINLSVSDLFMCLQWPSVIYCCMTQRPLHLEREWVCQTFGFISSSTSLASVLTVLAMSIERAVVARSSVQAKNLISIKHAYYVTGLIWFLSLLTCMPPLMGHFNQFTLDPSKTSCVLDYLTLQPKFKTYILVLSVFFWFLPTVLLIISYVIIIVTFFHSSSDLKVIDSGTHGGSMSSATGLGAGMSSNVQSLAASTSNMARRLRQGLIRDSFRLRIKPLGLHPELAASKRLYMSQTDGSSSSKFPGRMSSLRQAARKYRFREPRRSSTSAIRESFSETSDENSNWHSLATERKRMAFKSTISKACEEDFGEPRDRQRGRQQHHDSAVAVNQPSRQCTDESVDLEALAPSAICPMGHDTSASARELSVSSSSPPPQPPLNAHRQGPRVSIDRGFPQAPEPGASFSIYISKSNQATSGSLCQQAQTQTQPNCKSASNFQALVSSQSILTTVDSIDCVEMSNYHSAYSLDQDNNSRSSIRTQETRLTSSSRLKGKLSRSSKMHAHASRTSMQIRLAKTSFYLIVLWLVSWGPIAILAFVNSLKTCHYDANSFTVFLACIMTKIGPTFDVFIYGISHPKINPKFMKILGQPIGYLQSFASRMLVRQSSSSSR